MGNHRIQIDGYDTLGDILPKLKILFVGKVPTPNSVSKGHYFQGRQGQMMWKMLKEYGILKVPEGEFPDDHLLSNQCGIVDIVKKPRPYGIEPTAEEYRSGTERILSIIQMYQPKVLCFIYKAVLDKILKYSFQISQKSSYGFNEQYSHLFNSHPFVFPMPGTQCNKENIKKAMIKFSNFS